MLQRICSYSMKACSQSANITANFWYANHKKFIIINKTSTWGVIIKFKNIKNGQYCGFRFLFLFAVCWAEILSLFFIFIYFILFYFFVFIFFYCSGFCHTFKWISHGFTCVPHPDPPSHLPLHPLPLGLPSATDPSACLMHSTWAGDLFHPR